MNKSPLKTIKNTFYLTLKALFIILRYLKFSPDFYGHVGKQLDKKNKTTFKIYDLGNWETSNYNIHFTQYLKKQR